MKSSLLLRFKPLVLLIAVPLLLTNCATEDAAVIEAGTNANELRARLISLDEVKQMPKVMEKLNAISQAAPSANMRTVTSSNYKFSIDTERTLLIEKDNYQSFTFPIVRDSANANGYMENLFLHPHNGSYLAFLFRYDLTQDQIDSLNNGIPRQGLFEKLKFTPLDNLEIGHDINVDVSSYGNGGGYSGTLILYDGQCWTINNVWTDADGAVWYDLILCPGCTSCGGSGGGSGSPGSSGPGFSMSEYLAIWDLSGGGGGGVSTGGSWGGGGGGGNGGYNPFNPPASVDPNGNITTHPNAPGLYNGNPVLGIVSPKYSSLDLFLSNLTPEQMSFWNDQDNEVMVQVIKNYLSKTSYFGKNGEVVRQMIGYLVSQESSDDSILSVEQIIDFLGDIPTEEQLDHAEELLDVLTEYGGTIEFTDGLTSENSISFEEFKEDLEIPYTSYTTQYSTTGGQKTASHTFRRNFLYDIEMDVIQNMSPYEVDDVTTDLTGVTYARSWTQSNYTVEDLANNNVSVVATGIEKTYILVGEIGEIYSRKNKFGMNLDKSDGHVNGTFKIIGN